LTNREQKVGGDWIAEIKKPIQKPGCFDYYLKYGGWRAGWKICYTRSFNVEPTLLINGDDTPIDALVVQTVVTKCLGPLNRWKEVSSFFRFFLFSQKISPLSPICS
jgi:hypothetical protein